ncbi:ANTAR domain-containing response regulator [Cellulosilyticum lentocellum]|uniref:ANTAR domain protein n=1 Tax=Cellulosilyticum lentocellum (strain ATCC 49066 / DSM 5427 / NCIMB 11756 / RHM5) TaxID=642492 RepID=F2JNM9_CELLD|nr:ANTAR domain-containing protein [Cellulosilyticum lentocellum]ADZ85918.1 ANTAR domain protein [Cellulosilyticum lentocellum DSM 5427]
MEKVLIISTQKESSDTLFDIIKPLDFSSYDYAASGGEARRKFDYMDFDLTIINTPLSDEFGTDLALDIAEKSLSAILLLVKSDIKEQVQDKVSVTGAFVVGKPINRQVLLQTIPFVLNSKQIIATLREQNQALKRKVDDVKVIERAKFCLIKYLGLDEKQAHRYIQKQAMDMRIAPRAVADNILKTYEI